MEHIEISREKGKGDFNMVRSNLGDVVVDKFHGWGWKMVREGQRDKNGRFGSLCLAAGNFTHDYTKKNQVFNDLCKRL